MLLDGIKKDKKPESKSSGVTNPYVLGAAGKKEWNDRYMNQAKSIRNWQTAFATSMLVTILLTLVTARIATESHVEPFIVETSHGMPYAVSALSSAPLHDAKLINFAVNQFIINSHTVLSDPAAQKNILNKVYAYSANDTLGYLKDYFNSHNPYDDMGKYTISVEIVNSMPLSGNTWQVTWDETKRDVQTGDVVNTSRWMGDVTYKFGEVNRDFINDNPFGFYVTNVSWSKSES